MVVPRLDAWKEAHGGYPALLQDLGEDVRPPKLIHGKIEYRANDPTLFSFDVPDPGELAFPSGWRFTSTSRDWSHYH
jgi:hypothetical protein